MFGRRSPSSANTSLASEIEGGNDIPANVYTADHQIYTSNYATTINEKQPESDLPPKYELFLVKQTSDNQQTPPQPVNTQQPTPVVRQYQQQDYESSIESSISSIDSTNESGRQKAVLDQPPKFEEIYHTKAPLDDLNLVNGQTNHQLFLVY